MKSGVCLLFAAQLIGGSESTPESRFYQLGEGPAATAAQSTEVSLALGPIGLPQYLDRPQIVSRGGDSRLNVDEFNRWGGALDEEIERVLVAQLGRRLGTARIYRYPSRIVAATDYRVALEIRSFDGPLGGSLTLDLAWSPIDERSADVVEVRRAEYTEPSARPDYDAYAASLGRLLARLSDDIAAAVRDAVEGAKKNPPRSDG